jgi:flagellar hook-associated protein FlgK
MRGSFFGMNVSLSGLYTSQRNMDTISHNIANIQTDGYSRQQVTQQATSPIRLYNKTGMVGTGSTVVSVARVRDVYLDQKYWYQNTSKGEWTKKLSLMEEVQERLDETSADGYSKVTNDFYDTLQELTKDPSDMSIRAVVKEQATTMAEWFNNAYAQMEKMQSDANFEVKALVEKINSIGHRIESLNRQIYTVECIGEAANDLRDARDLLVDELSSYVNVEVGELNYGKLSSGADDLRFYVYIGDMQFIQHFDATGSAVNEIQCVARDASTKVNEEDIDGLFDLVWTRPKGYDWPVQVTGGELRALLDVRDGNAGEAQYARYDMLGSQIAITLNDAGATTSLTIDFNEYVRDVENMTAGALASLLQDRINAALEATGNFTITPTNRASVTTTADGKLLIDLSTVTSNAGTPASPTLDAFTFTAPASLKAALGLNEVPADVAAGASQLASAKDIVQEKDTPNYKGLPYFMRKLNEYVRTYAMAFNEGFVDQDTDKVIEPDEVLTGHANGYNITQQAGEPPAEARFFTMTGNDGKALGTGEFIAMSDQRLPSLYGLDPASQEYQDNLNAIYNAYHKMTAKNFSVSADIQGNVALIATSAAAGDVEDNTNLRAVMAQRNNRHMFSEGSAEDFMQSLTTDAAVNTSQADFLATAQENFVALLATRRESISGVSQDEEFADLIKQQHAYNASAAMISTFNEIYDTLINGLGI